MSGIQAIDVHGHYGPYRAQGSALYRQWLSSDGATIAQRAQRAGIEWTAVSPLHGLLPAETMDAAASNRDSLQQIDGTPGLLFWVVVNPRQPETFTQARQMLSRRWCAGIKLHAGRHGYDVQQDGPAIFELAAEFQAVVLTHTGTADTDPAFFVPLANAHPDVSVILAHLGATHDGQPDCQVRAIQQSRHGNMYVDTSSKSSLTTGLIEFAVQEVGPQRVLFGSDVPIYSAATQKARIETAEITDAQRQLILRDNAWRLLRMEQRLQGGAAI